MTLTSAMIPKTGIWVLRERYDETLSTIYRVRDGVIEYSTREASPYFPVSYQDPRVWPRRFNEWFERNLKMLTDCETQPEPSDTANKYTTLMSLIRDIRDAVLRGDTREQLSAMLGQLPNGGT